MREKMILAHLIWDPSREFIRIPGLDYPIVWYGLLFALGFWLAYLFMRRQISYEMTGERGKPTKAATVYMDRLLCFAIAGALIGARLAEVLFYDWPYYSLHPGEILKIWRGGLASHGGVTGVILAVVIFYWQRGRVERRISFWKLLDLLIVATMLVATCIRMGNFFNQEILGRPTDLPWAVLFLHPVGGAAVVPRHPVQLYESAFYILTFIGLCWLRRRNWARGRDGLTAGIAFTWLFLFRIGIEFFKEEQSALMQEGSLLVMGQILSLPFVLFGLGLIIWSARRPRASY
jgi:phosphatidylglycerol---prolipoprotein diacylglyceryl transferase